MNHYEALGVPRDASPADIKQAFRRKALACHPDREGGSVEKMAAVNRAYEVLGMAERRKRYDETGLDTEPKGIEEEAQSILVQVFAVSLQHEDILGAARNSVREGKASMDAQRQNAQIELRKIAKQYGVVRLKNAGGENLVEQLLNNRRAELNTMLEKAARGDLIHARVNELLDAYESGYVAPPPFDPWANFDPVFRGNTR